MVVRAIAILACIAALGSAARADDGSDPDTRGTVVRDRPGFLSIAMRTSVGTTAVADDQHRTDESIGLAAVVTVLPGWRLAGEGELLWLQQSADVPMDVHAFGVRGQLAVRHKLLTKDFRALDLYVDAELGGGAAIYEDTALGRRVQPDGFIGIRAGYDALDHSFHRPLLEAELEFRMLVLPEGLGWIFGVGFGWGR